MTLHRIVVSLMLAATVVLALLYVSTFAVARVAAPGTPEPAEPVYRLESETPLPRPTHDNRDGERRYDPQALRRMA